MSARNILLMLGGTYHDFEGCAAALTPLLEGAGHSVDATYDLDALTQLEENGTDLVLDYTCLGAAPKGTPVPEVHSAGQANALVQWVRGGGALLAAHAATVAAQSSPALKELMGGMFVEHPPQFSFTVFPLYGGHPITDGIEAFTVHDEFYMELHESDVDVHMMALDRSVAYPMVWTRSEGEGYVAHVAMGHDAKVWKLGPYQRLMLQTVDWLAA